MLKKQERAQKLKDLEKTLVQGADEKYFDTLLNKKLQAQALNVSYQLQLSKIKKRKPKVTLKEKRKLKKEKLMLEKGKNTIRQLAELEIAMIEKAKNTIQQEEKEMEKLKEESLKPPSNYEKYKERLSELKSKMQFSPSASFSGFGLSHIKSMTNI